jgi:hypothetical protein
MYMRRGFIALIVVVVFAGLLPAQGTKVATATSTQPFTLNGETVNPSGVPSWPVMDGAELVAGSTPLTLTFGDGSRISLAPGSRAKVEMVDGKPVFRLLSGEAAYDLKQLDSVTLVALDSGVKPPGLRGTYAIAGTRRAATKFWTGKTLALFLGGGAAAAVGIGVAAAGGPAPVSPSR